MNQVLEFYEEKKIFLLWSFITIIRSDENLVISGSETNISAQMLILRCL